MTASLPEIHNEMILASAGSGKTFQLTNRYIALMAMEHASGHEVHPERIIAVTFTRKAAGEFFDAILLKLAKAATEPGYGSELAGDGSDPLALVLASLEPADFRTLLRVFIQRMPRLFLGTLDSFFSNVLRSFPAEFGLTGDFEVMDEYRASSAIDRVYEAVFRRRLGNPKEEDRRQADFLEAFRQATFGKEESNVIRALDGFVEKLHPLYLGAPDADYWGDASRIWDEKSNRWLVEEIDPAAEFERLAPLLEGVPARVLEFWDEYREDVAAHRAGMPFTKRIDYMLPRFLKAWDDLEKGHAEIKFDRTVLEFDPVACEASRRIVQWLIGGEIRSRLRRTRGVWELLHRYERVYAERVRRLGQLTFQDVQLLLAGHDRPDGHPAPLLSQAPGELERLRIDYRLDARYDHWLLDEFQDTNFLQWRVIANLVDEVVQDTSGARSLFQVGDIKQAIYAWRGGDTRLFTDIFERYNAHETRILPRRLDVSWRSGADVLEPVNRVFGDPDALRGLGLPEETVDRWQWGRHEVAMPNQDQPGYTCLLHPLPPGDGSAKAGDEEISELVRGILEEVRPTERGLSCAILVRSNRRGAELVDHLRATSDIPVASEAEQHIASDNPVCLALTSLFQLAAHPGDTFAWEHLLMSPCRDAIERDELRPGSLSRRLAAEIVETNFEETARAWATELEQALPATLDAFSQSRLDAFLLACREFDRTGSRDIDDFLAYAARHTVREVVDDTAVQVMTYHKSKGLTFDMVILPDLKGDSLTSARLEIGAKTNRDREIEWVLDMPRKNIVQADPVLGEYLAEKEAEAAYESLCLYYVGMTRARYANYLVTLPQAPRSTSMNFVRLLGDTLGGAPDEEPVPVSFEEIEAERVYQSDTAQTDPLWYEAATKKPADAEEGTNLEAPPAPGETPGRLRPRRRTPSGSEDVVVTAAQVFQPGSESAREFGTLVHGLFEQIEWLEEEGALDSLLSELAFDSADPETRKEAVAQVRSCLDTPAIRALFLKPDESAEAWREKSFEILINDEWLSGVFDRVVIERESTGRARKARIIDFKTDRIRSEEDRNAAVRKYRPQLETYRTVLARLLSLEPASIEADLVFTRTGEAVTILSPPHP